MAENDAPDRSTWLAEVLDRFERPLVRYARSRVGDLEAARDLAQDCFLRLCRERPPPSEAHLAPWLFRVLRNLTVDHLRKNGRVHALERADLMVDGSAQARPDRGAQRKDEQARVATLVEGLPGRQQEVVRLKFQEGLSYRQIGEVTGISVTHVGVLLHTAVRTLRRQMAQRPAACEGSSR